MASIKATNSLLSSKEVIIWLKEVAFLLVKYRLCFLISTLIYSKCRSSQV
jgi:hypothetical protein